MNIVVLNGSPKGDISVTLQYVKYLQRRFSMHNFKIINIAHQIKNIENQTKIFDEIIEDIKKTGVYDFPQKNFINRMQNFGFILLTKIPKIKIQIQKDFPKYMIQGLDKIISSD